MPNLRTLGQPLIEESVQARKKEEENTVNSGYHVLFAIRKVVHAKVQPYVTSRKNTLHCPITTILFSTLWHYVNMFCNSALKSTFPGDLDNTAIILADLHMGLA